MGPSPSFLYIESLAGKSNLTSPAKFWWRHAPFGMVLLCRQYILVKNLFCPLHSFGAWEVRQILRIAGVDRLTCSVIWEMTGEGRILKQWSGRTVIRSCAKLAYDHAQDMIEGSFSASKPPVPLSAPHTWDQVGATSHMSLAQGPFMPSSSRPHGIP